MIDWIAIPWWVDVRVDKRVSSAANNGFVEDDIMWGIMPTWAFVYLACTFASSINMCFCCAFVWRCEEDPAILEKYGDHSQKFKPKNGNKKLRVERNAFDSDNPVFGEERDGGGLLGNSNRQQSADLGGVDPLRHPSGMYLRWDPTDSATAQDGEAAWTALMQKFNNLPPVDEAGAPQQQMAMVEFDAGANPWEDPPTVVPRGGSQFTPEKLTNMLRARGHLSGTQRVSTLNVVPLALQGVMSQTFKLEVRTALRSKACQNHRDERAGQQNHSTR